MKNLIKIIISTLAILSILTSQLLANDYVVESHKQSTHLPVLMYHHISSNSKDWGGATVSPEKFKSDMLAIKAAGYVTVHPDEVVNYKNKKSNLPNKPILITFDDGYYSNYEIAYPILKELNMKATIHIVGKSRGLTPGYNKHFSWQEAKEMSDSGIISIQSHTHDHHYGADKSKGISAGVMKHKGETEAQNKSRIKDDLIKNIKDIEDNVGKKVVSIAYPYGLKEKYTDDLINQLGIEMSFTVKSKSAMLKDGLYSMPRINVPQSLSSEDLIIKINNEKIKNISKIKTFISK